jgi:hypothetical protein
MFHADEYLVKKANLKGNGREFTNANLYTHGKI